MKRNYLNFLLFGILFVGIQEFWVTVIWRGEIFGFILAIVILEVLFLTVMYFVGKLADRLVSKLRIADVITFLLSGIVGLVVIEWMYAGNLPGQTEASQFVMFTTWGGATLFARMFTDKSASLNEVKKYTLRFFLTFTGVATLFGLIFLAIDKQISFTITYLAAIYGYPLMIPFFMWFFVKKFKN